MPKRDPWVGSNFGQRGLERGDPVWPDPERSGQSDRIPRTEAGRALVKWAPTVLPDWPWLLTKVLAIEDEAHNARWHDIEGEAAAPEPPLHVCKRQVLGEPCPTCDEAVGYAEDIAAAYGGAAPDRLSSGNEGAGSR